MAAAGRSANFTKKFHVELLKDRQGGVQIIDGRAGGQVELVIGKEQLYMQ